LMSREEAEKKLLEMLVNDEIVGYGFEGDEITIFVLKDRKDVVKKIYDVFGDSGFNITIVEVERVESLEKK
jgi:hypothetical protein